MKKLFAAFKNAPKRSAGLLMLAAAVIIPAVLWAWGPERPLYTIENAAPHVTFNSITNNQRMGNETNFVRIREVANGTNFRDDVQLEAGKTYEVMVFYHNNAKSELNDVTRSTVYYLAVTNILVTLPTSLSSTSQISLSTSKLVLMAVKHGLSPQRPLPVVPSNTA